MSSSTPENPDLVAFARAKFGPLSESELKLLCAATIGEFAFCGPSDRDDDSRNDPAQGVGWGNERTIRADLIQWLCVDHTAQGFIDRRGIRVHAAQIADALDLSFAIVPFPLSFKNCRFASDVNLEDGQLEAFYLEASRTAAVMADGLKVRGDLLFRNGNADGEVGLAGADIGGDLQCDHSTFKKGLLADGIEVGGAVFLDDGFRVDGEVRLIGADVGGNFQCDKGTFKNLGGAALSADGIKVGGDVSLTDRFSAEGEVRLIGADIVGNLECEDGKFKNAGGVALLADGIKVGGDVFLTDCFIIEGEVRLVGAGIGGNLECDGARFGPDCMVNAEQASVNGPFLWQKVIWDPGSKGDPGTNSPAPVPTGRLNLRHAQVGPMADDEQSWPSIGRLQLDGFVYLRIATGPTAKYRAARKANANNDANNRMAGAADAKSRLEWLSRQGDGFWPQPYRQLAKVLREAGDDSGARRVLIAMENSRLKDGELPWWSWVWAWVLRPTIGYGYRPFRAGWWVALFVLIGFFLFSWGQDAGVLMPIHDQENAAVYQPFNGFVYSLQTFLPLVDLQHAKHWLPAAEFYPRCPVDLLRPLSRYRLFRGLPIWKHQFGSDFGEWLRRYFWVHILAGWFFTAMIIAGVTGLVRKD